MHTQVSEILFFVHFNFKIHTGWIFLNLDLQDIQFDGI